MKARSFSHVGITVKDFNASVRFYWEMFGCSLVGVSDADPKRVRGFFNVDPSTSLAAGSSNATCKIGWLRVPGGGVIEIFAFDPQLPREEVQWNRVGITHFSLRVTNIQKWYAYLTSKGVTVLGEPEQSPNGGQQFFFIKDCDGNLIEIMDLRLMHYVLQWLGPLGGFLARHGWVKDYSGYYTQK